MIIKVCNIHNVQCVSGLNVVLIIHIVRHLFSVMNAKERIKRGDIKPADVPYEQRQGSYDNTDVNNGYVPSGMSVHEWHELQRKEKREFQAKEFGKMGPKGFMSRSLQAFQEDLEKGKVRFRSSKVNTARPDH